MHIIFHPSSCNPALTWTWAWSPLTSLGAQRLQLQHGSGRPGVIHGLWCLCRQTVAAADGGPGSAGRRPALCPPDGAVEALPGEALLQLEIQLLVPVQVRGLTLCLLIIDTFYEGLLYQLLCSAEM